MILNQNKLGNIAEEIVINYVCKAQCLRGRASDSRLRRPGFEFCAAMLNPWASFFALRCYSSLSCINWLQTVVDMYTSSLCTLIVAYGWMLPREVEQCLIEQVCRGSTVYYV